MFSDLLKSITGRDEHRARHNVLEVGRHADDPHGHDRRFIALANETRGPGERRRLFGR